MRRIALLILPLLAALLGCTLDPEASKQRLLETGNKYYENGKYKEASIIYRRAIQKDRRFGEAYYRLGLAEWELGRIQGAIGALTRAAELQPDNEDAYARLADIYFAIYLSNPEQNQNFLEELNRLTVRAEEHLPDSYHVHRIRGYFALSQSNFNLAINEFRRAIEQRSDEARVHLGLVEGLAGAGRTEEAETLAREFIEKHKDYGAMYDALYAMYIRGQQSDKAGAVLQEKCANNPAQTSYRLQLARHYLFTRNPKAMTAVLDEMLSRPQEFPGARVNVGDFYRRIGDLDRAIQIYRTGAEVDPARSVEYRNRIVETLATQGKQDEAFRMVESILKEDGENSQALALRGALRLSSGNRNEIDRAVADLENVLSRMPRNPVLRHNLGEAYLAQGKSDRALIEFQEAIKLRPDYLHPRYGITRAYLAKGDPAKAVNSAEEILERRSNDISARLLRCTAWIAMGERQQARKSLEEIVGQLPAAPEPLYQLARLNLGEKRFQEAEAQFRRLYERTPPDLRGLLGMADVQFAQGRADSALQLLSGAVREQPDNVALRMALADLDARLRRYDDAASELSILLAKHPLDALLNRALGEAYFRAGKLQQAEKHLKRAVELLPEDPAGFMFLGMLAETRRQNLDAVAYYEKVLEISPDHPVALNNLAYLLAENPSELDRALTLAQRARGLAPNDPNIADTLAWIYIKKDLADSAVRILDDLVSRNPSHVTWRYHLAVALFSKGDAAGAKQQLEAALKHNPTQEEAGKIRDLLSKVGS